MELLQTLHIFMFLFVLIVVSFPFASFSQGNQLPYMTSDAEVIAGMSFDYIIVGGGTAGCPLAATLSTKFKVLIIERGDSPYGNPLIEQKSLYGFSLLQTDEFSSVAQDFVSKDGVKNTRGRVLGGSSSINGGLYSRASQVFIKRVNWDAELVEEAYKWVESKVVFVPLLTQWQVAAEFGFLEAGILPFNGYNLEHVEGTKIGGTMFDEFGRRHTSADLLMAGCLNNITVLLNATVKSLIFDGNSNGSKVIGISFISTNIGPDENYEAYLNQPKTSSLSGDVILSAGAIGSPQILLLSGIGPEKHLKKFNLTVTKNLKGVGREMTDNPGIAVLVDTQPQNRQPEPPQVSAITQNFKYIIEAGIIPINLNTTRIPIAAKLAFPESKGRLKLNNTDPRQNPIVKFNYLSKGKDLEECVEMVALLQRVVRSESVAFFLGMRPQEKLVSSDIEVGDFCKKNVRTYFHFHGGCVVGSVVDEDYRVYGVKGLRVVDGSTFLESPGTNPMATVLMLGRYQGIKILRERQEYGN